MKIRIYLIPLFLIFSLVGSLIYGYGHDELAYLRQNKEKYNKVDAHYHGHDHNYEHICDHDNYMKDKEIISFD